MKGFKIKNGVQIDVDNALEIILSNDFGVNDKGTLIYNTDTDHLKVWDGSQFNILDFNYFTTGSTFNPSNKIATFTRNDGNTYELSLSSLTTSDYFTTGGTYSNGVLNFTRNDDADYSVNLLDLEADTLKLNNISSGNSTNVLTLDNLNNVSYIDLNAIIENNYKQEFIITGDGVTKSWVINKILNTKPISLISYYRGSGNTDYEMIELERIELLGDSQLRVSQTLPLSLNDEYKVILVYSQGDSLDINLSGLSINNNFVEELYITGNGIASAWTLTKSYASLPISVETYYQPTGVTTWEKFDLGELIFSGDYSVNISQISPLPVNYLYKIVLCYRAGEVTTANNLNVSGLTATTITVSSIVPSSSGDTMGTVGMVSWDDNYWYVKTNTGWKRTSLGGW